MTIPAFPSTLPAPRATMTGSVYLPQVRDESDAGYVSSRKRFTKSREKLTGFGWDYLSDADFATLLEFFLANQGGTFTWTHPITSASYVLGSAVDELQYQHLPGGGRSVEWPLEERS
jgi:hypothetical protein